MKITMTVEVGSEQDLAEARRLFNDCLDFHDTPKAAQAGYQATETEAPPPPPPPPPPPTENTTPPPPPPPPPSDVELDSLGHPWDERFHAGSKGKLKSGEWRRKKGVKKDDVVEALGSKSPESHTSPIPPTPPLAPPPPAPTNGAVTWETVVQAFGARSEKYTQDQIQAVLRAAVIEPTTLYQHPEQYAGAIAALEASCPV